MRRCWANITGFCRTTVCRYIMFRTIIYTTSLGNKRVAGKIVILIFPCCIERKTWHIGSVFPVTPEIFFHCLGSDIKGTTSVFAATIFGIGSGHFRVAVNLHFNTLFTGRIVPICSLGPVVI